MEKCSAWKFLLIRFENRLLTSFNAPHFMILQISERDEFNFIARAYLEPSTKVGPANEELLMPYVFYYSSERTEAQLSL